MIVQEGGDGPFPGHETAGDGTQDDRPLTGGNDSFGFGAAASWTLSGELPAGADLGGFTILRLLAEGGMGRVYEARQARPSRTVAVKVIREGVVPTTAGARLLREAETLATLRHPHIAQIHTCGTAPATYGGMPFLVMELVEGARSITRFCATRGLAIRDRVTLFAKVCDAVAHGHRHGVIHRDVKPANILVDRSGDVKVIDYGIARAEVAAASPTDADTATPGGALTAVGDVVGTLRYMSPEQVLVPTAGPDARSDVYSLGLVLHELVTGRLPYDLDGKSLVEARRQLGSGEAPPTTFVERAAVGEMPRDDARALAVIVATCLEPRAADRYPHAGELATDVALWLGGRPIVARPPTWLESMRRVARRHRTVFASIAALAVSLVGALILVTLLSVRLDRQRRDALAAEGRATTEAAAARERLYASTVLLAAAARDRGNVGEARDRLSQARAITPAAAGPQPIELACLEASLDDAIEVVAASGEAVTAVAWSPDGGSFATGDRGGVVRMWDRRAKSRLIWSFTSAEGAAWSVVFSPDGNLLATAAGDGTVTLHDARHGETARRVPGSGGTVYGMAFTSDGSRLATASRDRTARIHDVSTGRELACLRGHEGTVYGVAFAPDDVAVATACHDGNVRIWDPDTGELRATFHGHEDRVFSLAWSPDGRWLASASEDGTTRIWDISRSIEFRCLPHPARVNAVAFDAAGGRVATVAADGVVRTWDVERGVQIGNLRGHLGAAWAVAWHGANGRIVTGGGDGATRIWDPDERPDVLVADGRVLSVAHAPDGRLLATGLDTAEVALWDMQSLDRHGSLGPTLGRVHGVAWSPDGSVLAAACDDGGVFVWDVASQRRLAAVQAHTKRVYSVAFSPDGGRLATASEDRTVSIRDPKTGASAGPILRHPRRVFCAAFTVDGRQVATACEDRLVRLWDAATGVESARFAGHEGPVNWIACSPDGSRLATASSDGTVRLWRLVDASVERVLVGPASQTWKVAFSPDGARVAAAAADGTVHLWDATTGWPVIALQGHRDQVWAVAFAPDGGSLASGSWDGTARIWGVKPADVMDRRPVLDR